MKKAIIPILFAPLFLLSCASNGAPCNEEVSYGGEKEASGAQFDFPGNYEAPEIPVDGIEDPEYSQGSPEVRFGATNHASMKMYRGKRALFCLFRVEDEDVEVVGNNNGDDVTKSDSVEIYFDFKYDGAANPQNDDIQINIGAHGKTRIFVGMSGSWGGWNGLLDYEVKVDGTINDPNDVDIGYTVELMIPYAQVGIDENSRFGVSLGHVMRGRDSINETLPYTWGGWTFNGNFVDPQRPSAYVTNADNRWYSRDDAPVNDIAIEGNIVDGKGKPVASAEVKIGEEMTYTDNSGNYSFSAVSPNLTQEFSVSKSGYDTFSSHLEPKFLKSFLTGRATYNAVIFETGVTDSIVLTGVVENPVEGQVAGAKVHCGEAESLSQYNGTFSMEVELSNEMAITVEKAPYRASITELSAYDLVGNESKDIGVLALYSAPSRFEFSGKAGFAVVYAEIFRGFDGIHVSFTTESPVSGGDHIEFFLDTGYTGSSRDDSDYRIDFKGDGSYAVYHWIGGTYQALACSSIENKVSLVGTSYVLDAMVPYDFLGIEPSDTVGFSAGYWNQTLSDWDGWGFDGGFVAPEIPSEYIRFNGENGIYRAPSNDSLATKFYGTIQFDDGSVASLAQVNARAVEEDGSYAIWYATNQAVELEFVCPNAITQKVSFTAMENIGTPIETNITLRKAEVYMDCTVIDGGGDPISGVDIAYNGNHIATSDVDGKAYFTITSKAAATLVFSKEGYASQEKKLGAVTLRNYEGEDYVLTITLVAE